MNTILRATDKDAEVLVNIGITSFLESHGHSAAKEDIDDYVMSKFDVNTFSKELKDTNNHFYIISHDGIAVGYSKVIFDCPHQNVDLKYVTKMERLYLLKEFHHLKLGLELFNFNLQLSKKKNQSGIYLFVWTENNRALTFYNKLGFKIIGNTYFKISENHSNPNYQMLLIY